MTYTERPLEDIASDLELNVPPHTEDLSVASKHELIFWEENGEILLQESRLLGSNKNVTDAAGRRLDDIAFWRWKHRLSTIQADIRMRLVHIRAEMSRRGIAHNRPGGA